MVVKETGLRYLLLSLFAFSGLGIEVLYAFLLEPLIYQNQMGDWNTVQYISHWIITCITWGVIAYLLVLFAKKKMGFDIFEKRENMKLWQWIAVAGCVIFLFVVSLIDWNGLKIAKEFAYNGWLKFIFQYLYYAFETMLFMLIIVFGQKAFEIWTKKRNIPYGGILCAITWGLVHIFTKGRIETGLLVALSAFIFGVIHLLAHRDIRKTYLFLLVAFII